MTVVDLTAERERLGLTADCSRCFGLCCIAHGFRASATFAFDKLPGKPCPNLLADFGCTIHRRLRQEGFSGCTAYTCYGAGQQVAQVTFSGKDWRLAPETAELMFQTFPIMRQLHQLLWFITEALDRCSIGAARTELLALLAQTKRLTGLRADEMSWGAVDEHCLTGERVLGQVSAAIRAAAVPVHQERRGRDVRRADLRSADPWGADLRGADLRGADLRDVDLRGADLRGVDLWGSVLSGANLNGADLRWADLMGADLGRAKLAGADLSAAIFLTQSQIDLADGTANTILSGPLRRPANWSGSAGVPAPLA